MKIFRLKKYKIYMTVYIIVVLIAILTLNDGETNSIRDNPIKASNSEEVTQYLKETLMNLTFLELSFTQDELIGLLHEDISIRKVWINKVENYFKIFSSKLSYLITDKEIKFFYETLESRDDLITQYPDEIAFLKNNSVNLNGRKYLSCDEYAEKIQIYTGLNDNFIELSGLYYNLLILDGLNFVKEIKKNQKAEAAFRLWIKEINTEFTSYSLPITKIIERKRDFLLKKYESCQDPLIIEAMKYIKDAKIRIIE